MSQIVDFFNGGTMPLTDRVLSRHASRSDGITIKEILTLSNIDLETSHALIQWIFPLHEKSYHTKYSPVLSPDDIKELRASEIVRGNMKKLLDRFNQFYGLDKHLNDGLHLFWCNDGNHNLLRITRIIRSLRLFGMDDDAEHFYNQVIAIADKRKINEGTKDFWARALVAPEMESMTDKFLEMKRMDIR